MATVFASVNGLQAQDEADEDIIELDEFVVTSGIRESLAAGIIIKKASVQMVDALIAEDIGKFPDNNVVEALQRIPGVQTTDRARGEVNTVTIRGLNDVTTTINGRNIFTASGRSVALADIPASLLNRVDVYKTRSASLIENGIAGVIDVRTQRPFYFGAERTVIAARGIYSELSEELDPTISGLYTNVWDTDMGRFGALVNVSYAETNWTDKSITAGAMVPFVTETPPAEFGWAPLERIFAGHWSVVENPIWIPGLEAGLPFAQGSTLPMTPTAGGATQQVPYYLARDAVFSADFYGHRERPAINVALQWAPNDTSTYTVEAFYNGYREDWNNNLMFSLVDFWGALRPGNSIELIPGTNIIKARTGVGDPWAFMSGDKTEQKTDSYIYAITGEWEFDKLELKADLSYQTSEFSNNFQAIQTNRATPTAWTSYGVDVDFNDHNGIPSFSFLDNPDTELDESDLTDARNWNIGPFFDNEDKDKGDATEFKLDGVYRSDIDFIDNFKFGVRIDKRNASEFEYRSPVGDLNRALADFPEMQHINSGYFDGRADIPQRAMVIDADYLHSNVDTVRGLYGYPDVNLRNLFNITEKTLSAYVQADFRQDIGEQTLSGQFGVRYVNVERHLDFITSTASDRGDKLLPSAVLLYDINDQIRLRASYGETLRYPGFGDLNPNINLVDDVTGIGYGTASGGNPNLAPTESKNYDVSIEYYFGDASLLYVTAFKRKIDGLVVPFRKRITAISPNTGADYDYILSAPQNASNGTLDGWEFGLTWFPSDLPDWLQGFGVQASYTILDSIQDIPETNSAGEVTGINKTPFFAVSDSSYSVVLAYEREKYSVRLSYVWRDDFLHHYEAALFANPLGVYNSAQESLDLQVSFNVTDNFVITVDATNLTDEIFHSYYEYPDTHNFGNWLISRTVAVGARYSF